MNWIINFFLIDIVITMMFCYFFYRIGYKNGREAWEEDDY